MQVRRAEGYELPICAALYQTILRAHFHWIPTARHQAGDFLRAVREELVWVAVVDSQICGIAALYEPDAFIHSLYVRDPGQGVGKALLDAMAAASNQPLSLKCSQPNLRARAFYEREGFEVIESGTDPDGSAWWRMARP